MKEYRNFVFQNPTKMENNIITSYTTFVKENNSQSELPQDGKDVKIFYTVETKRIEIPAGSDRGNSKDDKRSTFDKIFKRIKKVSKFIKVPEPILTQIETKKYYACGHSTKSGFYFDGENKNDKFVVNVFTDVNQATEKCNSLNFEWRENLKKRKGNEDLHDPWVVISKDVDVYDLTMATVLKPEDEWVILGTIDHKDGLLKAAPGQQVPINLVPDQMVGQSYCDHCHRTINRNKTVFVQKIKTGEILRVGGSCIRNYLGYEYEKVLTYLTDISFLNESYFGDMSDSGDWDGENMGWSGSSYDVEISTREIIQYYYWWYKNHGYISKSSADKINQKRIEESGEDPDLVKKVSSTSSLVQKDVEYSHTPPDPKNYRGRWGHSEYEQDMKEWSEFAEKYEERVKTTSDEEIQKVIDFIHSNRDNNFIFNASNMIKSGSVQKRLLYYVTGACSWYFAKLAIEDAKKRESEGIVKQESNWVGTIGEKMKLQNLEIVHISGYDNGFGWTNVYKLKDQNGNIFTKFGVIGTQFIVKKTQDNPVENSIQVGDVVSATSEIKKHDEYKGVKQTTLGRFSKL